MTADFPSQPAYRSLAENFAVGDWCWLTRQASPCRVIERQDLWSEVAYRVWLPAKDAVVRARAADLVKLEGVHTSVERILHATAAAKLLDALEDNLLLAPIQSSVVPLPHQLYALNRAVSRDRIRYLLADEVGLGKTIEAGLVLRELKLRGRVKRILVVAPKGLVRQWQAEMRLHFGETFQFIEPSELAAFRNFYSPRPPLPIIRVNGLPDSVTGTWSLWEISLAAEGLSRKRFLPVFINEAGRPFVPTAKRVWDLLLTETVNVHGVTGTEDSVYWFEASKAAANTQGERIFAELLNEHRLRLKEERERARYAFEARGQAIGRIGLPAVREHRRKRLQQEHDTRMAALEGMEASAPDLNAVMMVRVGVSV